MTESSQQPSTRLFRLNTAVQQYHWGKTGSASLAARLANNSVGLEFKLDEGKSYAEIWMGTHPNGPSMLFDSAETSLQALISANPSTMLGAAKEKWPRSTHIPFLFKILSIEKALPLQAHPDKALAEQLRARAPALASDANHKPEIAVAIGAPLPRTPDALPVGAPDTAFIGFVGFRPLAHIVATLQAVPELRTAVGDAGEVDAFVHAPDAARLKRLFAGLLGRAHGAEVGRAVLALVERVRAAWVAGSAGDALGGGEEAEQQARLLLKVDRQYPGDVGTLATVFFMNFVALRRGEAIYIGADEVHAYLEGDIVECMAVSDNVLNAAFVSEGERASQVPAFLEMLTYTARPPEHWALPGTRCARGVCGRTTQYAPPLEEFVVLGTALSRDAREEGLEKVDGPTMGIVTRGRVQVSVGSEEMVLDAGGVVFVLPRSDVQVRLLEADADGEGEVWWSTCVV